MAKLGFQGLVLEELLRKEIEQLQKELAAKEEAFWDTLGEDGEEYQKSLGGTKQLEK